MCKIKGATGMTVRLQLKKSKDVVLVIIRVVFGEVNRQQGRKMQFKGLNVPISTGHIQGEKNPFISKVDVRIAKTAQA